jgi:hypothetical protein
MTVYENRVLRRIVGPKTEEVAGGWTLRNEELHNVYASLHVIRVIKSRRMRWVEHVASTREMRNICTILIGKLEWRRPIGRSTLS